ncbi:MAG: hypothetical protein ACKVHU_16575 [Acidimicrobiales bacterium]|jgi:precorrin-8X/cobalt-precorrin-8 methylmutase
MIFDEIVCVDWSAAASPSTGKDSIWIAVADASGTSDPQNFPTRSAADAWLRERAASRSDRRLLIGIDISFAAPAGLAASLGRRAQDSAPWRFVWEQISDRLVDEDTNHNNRFEVGSDLNALVGGQTGPFWGHPPSQTHQHLAPTRPSYPFEAPSGPRLAEYRVDEQRARSAGRAPQSTWKLAYQASVGSQFLTGAARLLRFESDHDDRVEFWPLGTGFRADPLPGSVWIAEVWPSAWPLRGSHPIRDANQVTTASTALWAANIGGELATWLNGPCDLSEDEMAQVLDEEGWMLGPAANQESPSEDR